MAALSRPGAPAGGGGARTRFRDKRYTIPVLSIDLFANVHQTHFWSQTAILINGYTGPLAIGHECNAVFTFEFQPGYGLIDARVRKRLPNEKLILLDVLQATPDGQRLMAACEQAPRQDGGQPKAMRVAFTYNTVNWSLTGLLIDRHRDPVEPGQMFNGMIRLPRGTEAGTFVATVVRRIPDSEKVALRFTNLPEATFALLEAAMKKS